MADFYRIEFVHGPLDGLVVEEKALVGPRLRVPTQACSVGAPKHPSALYELSHQNLAWDEGAPQAVLRYEFRGELNKDGTIPGQNPPQRWYARLRDRVVGWLKEPLDYPMSTRSMK